MSGVNPKIEESWESVLMPYFKSESFSNLKEFLIAEQKKYVIYPRGKDIFNAFNLTPFDKVKVVIIGQDPYHGKGQAHGLSFSVRDGVKPPPSLQNIFKELHKDLKVPIPVNGNLEKWARQGVLLLNATLTVRSSEPASHQGQGWEEFTDGVISELSKQRNNIVFLLWGKFAGSKAALIDQSKHQLFTTTHPSPFSAHRGFMGSGQFSKTNLFLKEKGLGEIDWTLE